MCKPMNTIDTLPAHDSDQAMVWHNGADGSIHGHAVIEVPLTEVIDLQMPLLDKNDRVAAKNRKNLTDLKIVGLNLVSSPGSGKTALLERTLLEFGRSNKCAVIVGDLETDRDAQRLRGKNSPVVQITTGNACHLDADMVAGGIAALDLVGVRLLFIENVGNLVCPASFDLGESIRVVLLSCTEGEDKPLKYPPIFKSADVVLLTKVDIASVLNFNIEEALGNIRRVAPQAKIIQMSSRAIEGMDGWYAFLRSALARAH